MLDVTTYAFTATTALAGTGGRDTGFMARGYVLRDKLEYRGGLFQGLRQTGSRNAFRQVARLQYNFFDTEVYNLPSYSGGNFGAKKIVAIGTAWDKQNNYKSPTADVYVEIQQTFGEERGQATSRLNDGGAAGNPCC